MKLSSRQEEIIRFVKEKQPITSEELASKIGVTRAALRADLAVLTMIGVLDARPKIGYVYIDNPSENIVYDYISNIKVKDIMSKPCFVKEDIMVYDAIVNLFLNDVGTLFVVDDNQYILGAVSRKDFLKIAIGGTDIHRVPVGVIMTRMPNIIWASKDEGAVSVAKKIMTHEIDSIPVVEKIVDENEKENYKIIGKVSKTNITKLFLKLSDKK